MNPAQNRESNNDNRRTVRESVEPEGTLLIPTAQPVHGDEQTDTTSHHVLTSDFAASVGHFELQDQFNVEGSYPTPSMAKQATVIPEFSTTNNPRREKEEVAYAARLGRALTQQEIEEIQRANRKVNAINYFAREDIKQANKLGRLQNRKEESGCDATFAPEPVKSALNPPASASPEESREGSFGKKYEVTPYDTRNYSTTEYTIPEYKSVYDSSP